LFVLVFDSWIEVIVMLQGIALQKLCSCANFNNVAQRKYRYFVFV